MTDRSAWMLAMVAAAVAAGGAVWFSPFAQPLYFYLDSAREWLATGRMTDHHAVGYPLLLVVGLAFGGLAGVLWLHAAMLVAIAAVAFRLLRALGLGPVQSLAGALPVALHPLLVVNVTKISDNNLSVLLLLMFAGFLTRTRQAPLRFRDVPLTACFFGALLLVRPNLALLFGLGPLVAWSHRERARVAFGPWVTAVAAAFAITLGVNASVQGRWQVSDPYYVAYTFHNGNNPLAAEYMLRDTIGEYSTYRVLDDEGIPYADIEKPALTPVFWRLSVEFIREHPGAYLELLGVKLMNFFRPYYRGGDAGRLGGVAAVVQTAAALPILVWAVFRWRARARVPWDAGLLAAAILPLYVLPFVVFNAEPRYRWPLDALLILESVWLVLAPRSKQTCAAGG
jgi:hypothetical protein